MIKINPLLGTVNKGVISGLLGGGDEEVIPSKVARTQQEVDAANALAKRLLKKNSQNVGTDVIAVNKVGDKLPEFIDSRTGKAYVGTPKKQLPTNVPAYVTLSDIKSKDGQFWYEDPKSGDVVDIDPSVVSLPRFRKK